MSDKDKTVSEKNNSKSLENENDATSGGANATLDRRRFLQVGGASVAALSASGAANAAWGPERLPREEKSTVIVGSGFGGAISALRLTEAGEPVTILEKGMRWDGDIATDRRFSKNLYPDRRSTWLSRKTVIPIGPALPIGRYTGVLQGRKYADFDILSGAAYGGGSIVYGGILKQPDPAVFKQVFDSILEFDELQAHYAEVAGRLNRSTLPAHIEAAEYFKHVRVCKAHADRSGIAWEDIATATRWNIVDQEIAGAIPPSIIHGEAVYGVNSGAKVSLDQTYLKAAEDTGLMEVKTLHQVTRISALEDGRYALDYDIIDTKGRVRAQGEILTRRLILSAGTLGTNELLVTAKAKGDLPLLNDKVGEGFGNNGNVYGLRLGLEPTGRWQGGPPAVGLRDYDNEDTPIFIEHPQFPLGIEVRGLLYFGVGITPTRGHFYYCTRSKQVKLSWPKDDPGQAKVNRALLKNLEQLNRDNGGFTARILDGFRSKTKDDAVYHPLGGCVLGQATDRYGRIEEYPGLYVNDGSMLPGSSACTNPSFTISAIAERNIADIIARDLS